MRSLPGANVTRKIQILGNMDSKVEGLPREILLPRTSPGLPAERRDSHSGPVDLGFLFWLSWWDCLQIFWFGNGWMTSKSKDKVKWYGQNTRLPKEFFLRGARSGQFFMLEVVICFWGTSWRGGGWDWGAVHGTFGWKSGSIWLQIAEVFSNSKAWSATILQYIRIHWRPCPWQPNSNLLFLGAYLFVAVKDRTVQCSTAWFSGRPSML